MNQLFYILPIILSLFVSRQNGWEFYNENGKLGVVKIEWYNLNNIGAVCLCVLFAKSEKRLQWSELALPSVSVIIQRYTDPLGRLQEQDQ